MPRHKRDERYADFNRDYPKRFDSAGRALCRNCGRVLPRVWRSWCSNACYRTAQIRCGVGVRDWVRDRDRGKCARCGLDTEVLLKRLADIFNKAIRRRWAPQPYWYQCYGRPLPRIFSPTFRRRWWRLLARVGLARLDLTRSLWEAHHKVPVRDGGGSCGLDNYETLCVFCHKKETAGQRKAWAKKDCG